MAKILLVEDDINLSILLKLQLEQSRHIVDVVHAGIDALTTLKTSEYELVILDWMLPDIPGIDVCRQYRGSGGRLPILMLTARGTIDDKSEGLHAGADDYMVKPFHPKELDARVVALLRRPSGFAGRVLNVQDIELDSSRGRVTRSGREVELTAKEFSMLELLMRYPNQSFTLEAIIQRVWASDTSASIETVRTHMKTLRKKLGDTDSNSIIRTRRGQGYRILD